MYFFPLRSSWFLKFAIAQHINMYYKFKTPNYEFHNHPSQGNYFLKTQNRMHKKCIRRTFFFSDNNLDELDCASVE